MAEHMHGGREATRAQGVTQGGRWGLDQGEQEA